MQLQINAFQLIDGSTIVAHWENTDHDQVISLSRIRQLVAQPQPPSAQNPQGGMSVMFLPFGSCMGILQPTEACEMNLQHILLGPIPLIKQVQDGYLQAISGIQLAGAGAIPKR